MQSRVLLVVLLVVSSAAAQRNLGSAAPPFRDFGSVVQHVRVHLDVPNGSCGASARVTMQSFSGPFLEGVEDKDCDFGFSNVPEGDYSVRVSGSDLSSADVSSSIHVSADSAAEFSVRLKRTGASDYRGLPNAFVSAPDLAVPNRARKELEKAIDLSRQQKLQEAIQRLNKAIQIYPQYAVAYNNLGALYGQLGDRSRENEALQKAISLNPKFALAYLNLGRMEVKANNFAAAEPFLAKAAELNPADVSTLVLLSYSEFMDKSFDAAIITSRKAHSTEKPHAFAHRVAARAFEQKEQNANAVAELETFLREEPSGPRADAARQELETLRAALPN
jgi:tetratricopeptide (TPR) repeat protein